MLFTNDGKLINRILHPSFLIAKDYEIKLNKPLSNTHKNQLSRGFFLSDGPVSIDFKQTYSATHFLVSIHIGRNRILRRAFEFFGYTIIGLHRLSIGPIDLLNLSFGKFEKLPVKMIKSLVHD